MKKILSLIMLFTFIFTLASCVNPKDKAFLGMEAPFPEFINSAQDF